MNAGAYGGELKQVVESVTILTMDGEEKHCPAKNVRLAIAQVYIRSCPA